MTFSNFNCHTNAIFIELKLLKICNVIKTHDLQSLFTYCTDTHNTNVELKCVFVKIFYLYVVSEQSLIMACLAIENKTIIPIQIKNPYQIKSPKKHFLYTYSLE